MVVGLIATHTTTQATNHLPPTQDFATKVLLLINIYIYIKILSHRLPNSVLLIHDHNALPPKILDNLINTFQLTQSYFSRPLTSRSL